ncbi:polysaccharide biosynthesis/export family protein [Roseovarius salinarum]|uniref:polysaccharide biosynthesis/export family protein n=1 Tax=Roseovarius salinarum TaxID=1981892 RepID=UPI001E5F5CE2|nr:polysaccharide biosynthesis/export family protein [Roseovarius salinarum]
MRTGRRFAGFIAILVLLSACSLPRGAAVDREILVGKDARSSQFAVVEVTRDTTPIVSQWPATGWSGEYRWFEARRGPASGIIRPGDTVKIVIWDNQENSLIAAAGTKQTELPPMEVGAAGEVFLPYMGKIKISGMTQEGARDRLQSAMSEIAPSAQVQLAVRPGHNNAVDVVSGVGQPGSVPLPDRNTTILSVFAKTGGISSQLRNPLVRLHRGGNTYEIRADALVADAGKNVTLRGGDKVAVVEDDRSFTAFGASGREEIIYFQKEYMTAMDAISAMGGLSDNRANPRGVLVLREYAKDQLGDGTTGPQKKKMVFTINLTTADGLFAARNFHVNPEDTVVATESPVTAVETVFDLIGSLVGLQNRIEDD